MHKVYLISLIAGTVFLAGAVLLRRKQAPIAWGRVALCFWLPAFGSAGIALRVAASLSPLWECIAATFLASTLTATLVGWIRKA